MSLIPVDDDSWNPWGEEFERKGWHKPHPLPLEPFIRREKERDRREEHPEEPGDEIDDLDFGDGDQVVEIWGKAALGKINQQEFYWMKLLQWMSFSSSVASTPF